MTSPILISIMIPSRRLNELVGLLDSLKENTRDLNRIEVLVKYDDDQPEFAAVIEEKRRSLGINIRGVSSPRLFGVLTMWVNLQLMWKIVSPQAYFVLVITDEGRFIYKHWDDVIAKYENFYPDNIFRLRASSCRYVNYYSLNQTVYAPDSFPIYTKRWLDITQGFGDCWGSDAFMQSVVYHLGRGTGRYWLNFPRKGIFRDLVIHEKLLGGIDDFGQNIKADEKMARTSMMYAEWRRLMTHRVQAAHCKLARKLLLEIEAHALNLSDYSILERKGAQLVGLYDNKAKRFVARASYYVPRWYSGMAWFQFAALSVKSRIQSWRIKLFPSVAEIVNIFLTSLPDEWRLRFKAWNERRLSAKTGWDVLVSASATNPATFSYGDLPSLYDDEERMLLQYGPLFSLKDGKLTPTQFLLKTITKARYAQCTTEELNTWIDAAYGPNSPEVPAALKREAA